MIPIATATAQFLTAPAPVFILDTCVLIDLFRSDPNRPLPVREELQAAADLLQYSQTRPVAAYVVVPELVPREYEDNATKPTDAFEKWLVGYDEKSAWIAAVAGDFGAAWQLATLVAPLALASVCRKLADELLGTATHLARDTDCLERAMARVIEKRPPSHKNEIKDSMNLEQSLELSRQLQQAGFPCDRVFISSNPADFAASETNSDLHPDLRADLAGAGLRYFRSIRAAIGEQRAAGQFS